MKLNRLMRYAGIVAYLGFLVFFALAAIVVNATSMGDEIEEKSGKAVNYPTAYVDISKKKNYSAAYSACIGPEYKPLEKDGKGSVCKWMGETLTEEGALNAPKGMVYHEGKFYVSDIDRLVCLKHENHPQWKQEDEEDDEESEEQNNAERAVVEAELDFAPLGAADLGELVLMGDKLVSCCATTGKLFVCDLSLAPESLRVLELQGELKAPRALAWDAESKLLYIGEGREGEETSGRLLTLDPATGELRELSPRCGYFYSLAYKGGYLYVADWSRACKPNAVSRLCLADGSWLALCPSTPLSQASGLFAETWRKGVSCYDMRSWHSFGFAYDDDEDELRFRAWLSEKINK